MTATLVRAEVTPTRRGTPGKSRLYISVSPDFPEPAGPPCTKADCQNCRWRERQGIQPEVDHDVWMREYFRPACKEATTLAAEAFGREAWERFGEIRWSKNAGCRVCPCSPGWVTSSTDGFDYHVTLEVAR